MKSRAAVKLASLIAVVLTAAACSAGPDVSGSPAQRLHSWSQAVGLSGSSARLDAELQRIAADARAGNLGDLQAVSVQLQDDATVAHSQLPSPDQQLTQQLNTAYQTAYRLANNYLDHGLGANRAAGLTAIATQADTARQALQSAQARAARVTGG